MTIEAPDKGDSRIRVTPGPKGCELPAVRWHAFAAVMLMLTITLSLTSQLKVVPAISAALSIPKPTGYVNDFAGLLEPTSRTSLEKLLGDYDRLTGNQIAVALFADLAGVPISEFASKLERAWGVGRRGRDNGVLIVVSRRERQVRIEIGYGLESKITDNDAAAIIGTDIAPAFRAGHYEAGLRAAAKSLMHLIDTGLPASALILQGSLRALELIPFSTDLSVNGDRAAWAEVRASYERLYLLSGHRAKMTGGAGWPTAVAEVVLPLKAFHVHAQLTRNSVEIIRIGDDLRFRTGSPGSRGRWQCFGPEPPASGSYDPSSLQGGSVTIARHKDATIDETLVNAYGYTYLARLRGRKLAQQNTLYVSAKTGLPRRNVVSFGTILLTLDYYDYGAPIHIAPPPCVRS